LTRWGEVWLTTQVRVRAHRYFESRAPESDAAIDEKTAESWLATWAS